MVQVNVDNEHFSTSVGTDEFFVTPKALERLNTFQDPSPFVESLEFDSATGDLFVGMQNGFVYRYDGAVRDATEVWSTGVGTDPITDLSVDEGGNLAAVSSSNVALLNKSNGEQVWQESLSSTGEGAELVSAGIVTTVDFQIQLRSYDNGSILRSASSLFGRGEGGSDPDSVRAIPQVEPMPETDRVVFAWGTVTQRGDNCEVFVAKTDVSDTSNFGSTDWRTAVLSPENRPGNQKAAIDSFTSNGGNTAISGISNLDNDTRVDVGHVTVNTNGTILYKDAEGSVEAGREKRYGLSIGDDGSLYKIQIGTFNSAYDPSKNTVEVYETIENVNQLFTYDVDLTSTTRNSPKQIEAVSQSRAFGLYNGDEIYERNTEAPVTTDATYKATITGKGPIEMDGVEMIPDGATETAEHFIDDGTRFSGSFAISGVRVK